jgi:hypothetical protein
MTNGHIERENFRTLNRRDRRKYDRWMYKLQWCVGTLAGLCILATIIAQVVRHVR